MGINPSARQSAPVKTPLTPGIVAAAAVATFRIFAWG
jgi:hypothetical protein